MYQCTQCDFTCSSVKEFLDHNNKHITDKTKEIKNTKELFVCSNCSAVFNSCEECKDHMIKDHKYKINNSQMTPKTPEPETETNEIDDSTKEEWLKPIPLKELKSKLTQKQIHQCQIKGCLYKFESLTKREIHQNSHASEDNPSKNREFKCTECLMEIKLWRNCTKHMWKEHKIDIDLLKCPLCDYTSFITIEIFRHMQIHTLVKGYVCQICSKTFSQFSQLRCHQSSVHIAKSTTETKSRWYSKKTCVICTREFANSKTLSKHVKFVHNKIKPYICSVCGHKSARKISHVVHCRQHTNEKPYICKYCSYRSADPSCMTKHEMTHKNDYNYKCNFCSTYKTTQANSLKKHMKTTHLEEYKKIKCDRCGFCSINAETLKKHKKDHETGLIKDENSSDVSPIKNSILMKRPRNVPDKPVNNVEISSDCFLHLETTTDSEPALDTGGVTITESHSEDTQFPSFMR